MLLLPCWQCCSPIRRIQIIFCSLIAINVLRILQKNFRFYQWFSSSGLKIANQRGFGQTACRAYGILPHPPQLSNMQFFAVGLIFVLSLFASCTEIAPRIFLGLSLVSYWLYFGQLYCEAHTGAHVTVMIPPMLLICMFSADLTDDIGSSSASMLPIIILKIIITSAYSSAGISKLWASVKNGIFWGNGATLQYYIFEALFINQKSSNDGSGMPHFSFGIPSPFSYHFQRFLFTCPRLMAVLSVKTLIFETFAPAILFFPSFGPYFAIVGVGFHYGIALFQNIDFVSWWGPFYVIFFFENAAYSHDVIGSALKSYDISSVYTMLMFSYLAIHIGGIVYASFAKTEILPLSNFHMFSEPKNLWNPKTNKTLYLTEKPHDTGTLKNYAFPWCRPHHVTVEEFHKLPFKYLMISNKAGEKVVAGNVKISNDMQKIIEKFNDAWEQGRECYLKSEKMNEMLKLLDSAKHEFSRASRSQE